MAAGAEAEPAPREHGRVGAGPTFGDGFVDAEVGVLVLPVAEEEWPDLAVQAAREEGEDVAVGGGGGGGGDLARLEVDLGEGGVFFGVEVLGGVGVA